MERHPTILARGRTALLLVDIQERLWAVMHDRQTVAERITTMIKGCHVLGIPIFVTEQYPKGLGPTIEQLRIVLGKVDPLIKMTFSCCGSTQLCRELKEKGMEQIILAGIEAHVCVLQTALDLLSGGFQVHLLTDAVSSRQERDKVTALWRLSGEGAVLSTVETALFEMLATAEAPEFKEISKLVK
jgi:nicotinamidase-related amidase